MRQMKVIEGQIDITRRLIIAQLQEEIAYHLEELNSLHRGDRELERRGPLRYLRVIARKQQLLLRLAGGAFRTPAV